MSLDRVYSWNISAYAESVTVHETAPGYRDGVTLVITEGQALDMIDMMLDRIEQGGGDG